MLGRLIAPLKISPEIKVGLDSIVTLVNDQKFQNYQTAESIYPFFTRGRKTYPSKGNSREESAGMTRCGWEIQEGEVKKDSLDLLAGEKQPDSTNLVVENPEARDFTVKSDTLISKANDIGD